MSSSPLVTTTVLAILLFTITVVVISGLPTSEVRARAATSDVDSSAINGVKHLDALRIRREFLSTSKRNKRTSEFHIPSEECIFMTGEEGEYYYKATSVDGKACGIYIFSEPDQKIELRFNYLDVPCENGGLVAVVDGWELNGEFFPSPHDHSKSLSARVSEFCSQRKIKQTFISSQNVALIQYRMPARGTSFSFTIRFVKNPTPCNVMFFGSTEDIVTLKNYGKRVNCSISTLFPSAVKVAALNIGVTPTTGRGIELETGTIHKVRLKCQKRGLDDYVQIGGSSGLDNANLIVADSMCGLDSKAGKHTDLIACGTTTVRLVNSGAFDNSLTVSIRQLTEEDINGYMSVICPTDESIEK